MIDAIRELVDVAMHTISAVYHASTLPESARVVFLCDVDDKGGGIFARYAAEVVGLSLQRPEGAPALAAFTLSRKVAGEVFREKFPAHRKVIKGNVYKPGEVLVFVLAAGAIWPIVVPVRPKMEPVGDA